MSNTGTYQMTNLRSQRKDGPPWGPSAVLEQERLEMSCSQKQIEAKRVREPSILREANTPILPVQASISNYRELNTIK